MMYVALAVISAPPDMMCLQRSARGLWLAGWLAASAGGGHTLLGATLLTLRCARTGIPAAYWHGSAMCSIYLQ